MPISTDANALKYIRGQIGDLREGGGVRTDTILDNDMIDYIYDNDAGENVDKTITIALDMKCASLSYKVAKSDTDAGFNTQYQQERESICEKARLWALKTGVGVGSGVSTATLGELSLGIDEETADFTNP